MTIFQTVASQRPLMTFANSLEPDQARRNRRALSGSSLFATLIFSWFFFFKKVDFSRQVDTEANT